MDSEEIIGTLFQALRQDIFLIDKSGNLLDANQAACQSLGYTKEELKNLCIKDIVNDPKGCEAFQKVRMGHVKRIDFKVQLSKKDEKFIPAVITYIFCAAEKEPKILAIAEHEQKDNELRQREKLLNSILNSIQDGIGVLDKDFNIIMVNPTAEKWYPHARPFIGKKCYEAFHNRSQRCEICPASRTLKTGESAHDIIPKSGSGGQEVGWLEIYSFPFIDTPTGQLRGVIEFVRDITERKRKDEKLKLFSEVVEKAPDGVQIVDMDGYIIFSNRAVEEMYGFSREEFMGKHVNELNVDTNIASEVIIPSIKETGRWVGELMVKHKKGKEFPIWLTTSIVNNIDGKPLAMVGIIRDITKRKHAEEALIRSEERYRSLFEDSPIALLEEDSSQVKIYIDNLREKGIKDFRTYFDNHPEDVMHCIDLVKVIDVNKATVELFRAKNKEPIIKGLKQFFLENSYNLFREELIAIAENKLNLENEDSAKTLFGDEIKINLKWSVVPGYENTFSKILVCIDDVTELRRSEEAIKKYTRELEDSNLIKDLFTDVMSHDLLNPLNIVNGYIEILLEDEENPVKKSQMEIIKRNLNKALALIDNATMFSKLESLESIKPAKLDLKEIIESVIENIKPIADEADFRIENNITQTTPINASIIIEEVFSNLISNAIKYASEGKKVVIDREDIADFWRITVKDYGKGIRDSEKKGIFERFLRKENLKIKGSGLGLAIAGRIVKLHEGRIYVKDNPEGGAVFTVEIPK